MKVVFIILVSFLLGTNALAQGSKVEATKVDAYDNLRSDYGALGEKTHGYLEKLAEQPKSTKEVIIIYRAVRSGCSTFNDQLKFDDEMVNFISRIVKQHRELSYDRVTIILGDPSLRSSAEFWLVPGGAKRPTPYPNEIDLGCCCPTVLLIGSPRIERAVGKASFFVYLQPTSYNKGVKYEWSVSVGKIVSGQGSDEIIVDISKIESPNLTVSVNFKANPTCNCPNSTSLSVVVLKERPATN